MAVTHRAVVGKCILLHYSPFKVVWDYCILLLSLYTAIFTPYMVAFHVNRNVAIMKSNEYQHTRVHDDGYYNQAFPLVVVDLCVDIIFLIDIIINFRTTFVKDNEVVSDSSRMACNYLRGWFTVDALASLPFELLVFGSSRYDMYEVAKLTHLLRLLRVSHCARHYLQYSVSTLLLMLISFVMLGHWLACGFYVVGYETRQVSGGTTTGWLDTLAVQQQQLYVVDDPTSGPDLKTCYITALYFTMTALTGVGFGNVAPNTQGEKVFTIFSMMIGAMMSAGIFGSISSMMMRMYQGSEEMQHRTRSIQDFIKHHSISADLSRRMYEAFNSSWSDTNGVDMNSVLASFPVQIQADICLHLNRNLLCKSHVFKDLSSGCLRALSLRFKTLHAQSGDVLIHTGDVVSAIYFIANGNLEIQDNESLSIASLEQNDSFGIPFNHLSSATKSLYSIHASTSCAINKIEAYDLQDVLNMYPEFTEHFNQELTLTFTFNKADSSMTSLPYLDEKMLEIAEFEQSNTQPTNVAIKTAVQCSNKKEDELNDQQVCDHSMDVEEPDIASTKLFEMEPLHKKLDNASTNIRSLGKEKTTHVRQRELNSLEIRLDECVARVQRIENHWNQSIKSILIVLGKANNALESSYV